MSSSRDEFLHHFLANETAIRRTILSLVPNLTDAEDILQQTAVALWESFDHYDRERDFRPWACQFARNRALRWIDARKRWNRLLDRSVVEQLEETRLELQPALDDRFGFLRECIDELPSDSRTIIRSYYFDRSPVDEIARLTGATSAAIYKSLQRIRAALQECIERKSRLPLTE